jgi:hypothetical protein
VFPEYKTLIEMYGLGAKSKEKNARLSRSSITTTTDTSEKAFDCNPLIVKKAVLFNYRR